VKAPCGERAESSQHLSTGCADFQLANIFQYGIPILIPNFISLHLSRSLCFTFSRVNPMLHEGKSIKGSGWAVLQLPLLLVVLPSLSCSEVQDVPIAEPLGIL
jgi:hypothetical protein